jgi:signal transduction histidine kinase/CheY-like chemotaxis protein
MAKRKFTRRVSKRDRVIFLGTLSFCALAMALPFGLFASGWFRNQLVLLLVVLLNSLGWLIGGLLYYFRHNLHGIAVYVGDELGLDTRYQSIEKVIFKVLKEVQRKNRSLSINVVERRVADKQALSDALEKIVGLAFRLLRAESAELALFDVESGMYHSSFVIGKPFRESAQAMFSGVLEGEESAPSPSVVVQPIAFAGSVLGSLRVALPGDAVPSLGDREIMRILALQSGLAIINAEYTSELVRMKNISDETVRAKTGFLANLSHEIRGPLGIMLNAVELVLDGLCGDINEDQLDTLRMVRSNGEHLLELINDVLDYAKVESGKITPKPEDIFVNDLLKDIAGVVRAQAEAKQHKLRFEEPSEVLAITCDRRHLRQMLINLLTNAIKYTPNGGEITIKADRMPGKRIKISVVDTGVGIDARDRHKVFSAFERIENSYSMSQLGTGLGMSLTRRLVEVNGGQIDFDSIKGEGSEFWLLFPAISYEAVQHVKETQQEEPEVAGKNEAILLFEDDAEECKMMSRYLEHIGFTVIVADTRDKAVDALRTGQIELLLVDNQTSDHAGQEDVNEFREAARTSFLPIVLLTSRAFAFDIEKYLKEGVDLCLIKPVALKRLGRICRELIDGEFVGKGIDEKLNATHSSDLRKPSKGGPDVDDIIQ